MCPAPYILFGFVCWTSCFVLYYRWCVLLVVHRCVLDKGLQVVVCIKRAVDHPARHPALPQGGETSRLSSSSPFGGKSFKAESDS